MTHQTRVLVYACSGCSNVAQLANTLAVRLDHARVAEMSCIAGVGGNVRSLVRKARSDRPILAIDGCPLHCVAACLRQHGVTPARHVTLSESGLKKRYGGDFDDATVEQWFDRAIDWVAEAVQPQETVLDGR